MDQRAKARRCVVVMDIDPARIVGIRRIHFISSCAASSGSPRGGDPSSGHCRCQSRSGWR